MENSITFADLIKEGTSKLEEEHKEMVLDNMDKKQILDQSLKDIKKALNPDG